MQGNSNENIAEHFSVFCHGVVTGIRRHGNSRLHEGEEKADLGLALKTLYFNAYIYMGGYLHFSTREKYDLGSV